MTAENKLGNKIRTLRESHGLSVEDLADRSDLTVDDIKGADPSIAVLAQELNVMHIKLFLWGKKDPAYDDLERIPRADIVQMENPEKDVENMDFNRLMETIGKTISQLVSSGQATA